MKVALILESNRDERDKLVLILRWLGFVPTPVSTPDEAINVANAINCNVIVTSTAIKPNDRRALTSELKRLAPESALVFVADEEDEYEKVKAGGYPCISAVAMRPTTMDELKEVIQSGGQALRVESNCLPHGQERRR
jgi:DNA-binding NarL/FixJ family response regulator